jgi:hypothetical protein
MRMVELIQPVGQQDLEIVNLDRKLRGLPPSELVWVCQHSCAPETIPGCTDFNCEATLIVDQGDVEDIRDLVARGELAAFDRVSVELKLDVPRGVWATLQRFARSSAELPVMKRQGREFTSSGSLLAFARLCARQLDPDLSDGVRAVLLEIERVLTWEFSSGGPALFQQRFVDLRARPAERGNTITLLARADWPARTLVAWEAPPLRRPRRNITPPTTPRANAGFGLWLEAGTGIRLGLTNSDLAAVPGDLYGPTAHLVFRVDQEVADRVRGLCAEQAAQANVPPLDTPMLDLLAQVTRELGLVAPVLPPATGLEKTACLRPAQFIRHLLLAQPLAPVSQ